MSQNQQQDRDQIRIAVTQIGDAHSQITQIQSTLTGEINSLASGWKGQAAEAFVRAHGQFNERFEMTKRELNDIEEALRESVGWYEQNESEQVSETSAISNALNF